MKYLEVQPIKEICEDVIKKIFEGIISIKLEITEEIEKTDSGATRTVKVEFKPKENTVRER